MKKKIRTKKKWNKSRAVDKLHKRRVKRASNETISAMPFGCGIKSKKNMASHFTKKAAKSLTLTRVEADFTAEILGKVHDIMRFDPDISDHGQLHPDATFTDGGRFLLSLSRREYEFLFLIIEKISDNG
jgi:hypothetical protein